MQMLPCACIGIPCRGQRCVKQQHMQSSLLMHLCLTEMHGWYDSGDPGFQVQLIADIDTAHLQMHSYLIVSTGIA